MDYTRDRWNRDDGRSQHRLPYYHSETDSLDSTEPFILEPSPSSYETNTSQHQAEHHYGQARIEEIASQEETQTDEYSEEDDPNYHPQTFSPLPPLRTQRLNSVGDHHYIDETPLISPARYHRYTSPSQTQQWPTSQLSYEPDSRSASVSRSPESGNLIDHPSADVDQYFDFDAACAPTLQHEHHERDRRSKRRVEDVDNDSEEDSQDSQDRESRVEKRVRVRSPRRSTPVFHQPRLVPKSKPVPAAELSMQQERAAPSSDTLPTEWATQQPRSRKRSLDEVSSFVMRVLKVELTIQSGHDSVETVLKRPFRTPAPRVVLPKVTRKADSSPQSTPCRPTRKPSSKPQGFRSAPARLPLAPNTQQSSPVQVSASDDPQDLFDSFRAKSGLPKLHNNNNTNIKTTTATTTKKVKAFKPPLVKPADGPSSSISTSNRPNHKGESVMATITKLEKEARILRQAVRYYTNPDEDERLSDLISQWRMAGREVVEQLYDRIPEPDPETEATSSARAQNQGRGQGSSDWFTGGGAGASSRQYEMTEEQENYLKYCPRNQDGDPVDSDGNSLIPPLGDLDKLVEEEGRGRRGESDDYIPTYRNGMSGTRM